MRGGGGGGGTIGGAVKCKPSLCGITAGLLDRSFRYSSTQKSSLCCGLGVGFSRAIGLGGILISGRNPNGGGSLDLIDPAGRLGSAG